MAKTQRLMPNSPDKETLSETLSNLGVAVERKNEITGVKWASPRHTNKRSLTINVTKRAVYLPAGVVDDLNGMVVLGTGTYRGDKVLLIKPDPKGYKLTLPSTGQKSYVSSKRVVSEIMAAGLKPGYYKPVKIKGGWMGVPEK